jgi:RNA polymerase sigma factor (sigma-70 family)
VSRLPTIANGVAPEPGSTADEGDPSPDCHTASDQPIAALFARYHGKLVKSLVARTRSWEEARDIASQAFVEVLSQQPGTVNFLGSYLYRTARNLAINRLTHEAVRKCKEPIIGYEPELHPSPEPMWVQNEQWAVLRRTIGELSPRLRMALVLRIWDELSYDEIVARFAAAGVKLSTRTVQRYIAESFEHCRRAILMAENPPERGAT